MEAETFAAAEAESKRVVEARAEAALEAAAQRKAEKRAKAQAKAAAEARLYKGRLSSFYCHFLTLYGCSVQKRMCAA